MASDTEATLAKTDYGSTVGLSPINEDGAGIYRQVFITAGCVLRSSRKWRDAIEDAYANHRCDQLDLNAAVDELRYTVLHLDAAMTPYVVDGRIIDPFDERNRELLAKFDLDERIDLARQLASVRGGVFECFGFAGQSVHEVVAELGKATLRAVGSAAPVPEPGWRRRLSARLEICVANKDSRAGAYLGSRGQIAGERLLVGSRAGVGEGAGERPSGDRFIGLPPGR